jgi:DNA-binding response OmpR family regulator
VLYRQTEYCNRDYRISTASVIGLAGRRSSGDLGEFPMARILLIDDSAAAGWKAFAESLFDVAIVDIFLGDSNGFDVIVAMRERAPGLPVVAVSGMTALDRLSQSAEFSDVQRLQKPFRPNQLIAAIKAARGLVRQAANAAVAADAGT